MTSFAAPSAELILEAYRVGRGRGTSLSLGYYLSIDNKAFFCQNPNNSDGVIVGEEPTSNPQWQRVDMSDLLEIAEGRSL